MNKDQSLGEKLNPIFEEIAETLWEVEANNSSKPHDFPKSAMHYAAKIFSATLWDLAWQKQQRDDMSLDDRLDQVGEAGKAIREIILKYTGIDSHDYPINKSK